jgi:hypothetical protein
MEETTPKQAGALREIAGFQFWAKACIDAAGEWL